MIAKEFTKETIMNYGAEKLNIPKFKVGDTVVVMVRIKEGDKERLQAFQGDVIASRQNGVSSTFTVRKIASHNIAVERIFPYFSPLIKEVSIVRRGDVRRAKLYYIRRTKGKSGRIKEKVYSAAQLAKQVARENQ